MWVEKYTPNTLSALIGNPEAMSEIHLWANGWKQGSPQKPLLLVGPPGVGKTASAYALAREFSWSLVEFNSSDARDKDAVEKVVMGAAVNASFTGQLRLVLLDEIDGVQGNEDKGGLSAVLNVLKEGRNPIILTANDIYGDKRLASIRTYAKVISFKKVPYPSIAKLLHEIAERENMDYDAISLSELAKNSSGDVRAALLDLEALSRVGNKITLDDVSQAGYRERVDNIFNVIRTMFVSASLSEVRRARSTVEVDPDLLKKWVDENIPRQFPMFPSLAYAFDGLSRADIFDGRIFRRQHYGFLKYSGDLAASVGLRTNVRAHGFISYQFPGILKRLSLLKGSAKKSTIAKIQSHVSGSRKRIAQELSYWPIFVEHDIHPEYWVKTFDFDEDELGYLLNTSPSSAKIKKIMKRLESPVEKTSAVESSAKTKSSRGKKSLAERNDQATSPVVEKLPAKEPDTEDEGESKKQTSLSSFFGS
ncbi:MAG: replication factor C large subunit [Candidatus Diapherotrites archaeon]|uniref:Replication factor C large subunit n=1 Tax=Candidatus Iainarchaeum sp. TaxID=3101447 RepID=A0A8T4C7Y3_9ARCH|nr:replication factor C large subunit [Candidatus Diapherotrites archaeon]